MSISNLLKLSFILTISLTLPPTLTQATEVPVNKPATKAQTNSSSLIVCISPQENCQDIITKEIKQASYYIAIETQELSNNHIIKTLSNNKTTPKELVTNKNFQQLTTIPALNQRINKNIDDINYILIDGTTVITSTNKFSNDMDSKSNVVYIIRYNYPIIKKFVTNYKHNRR